MYPRNAASPERIAIGAVVQISDGAVQTSGVSIAVIPQGGASGAGGGTTAYDNGIVLYTPTQPETDYASFIVIAYKASCIPVSQTIVTSKSNTTGYAGIDWGQVLNATTTVGLSGTTVKTATDVETDTADIQARLPAALTADGNIKADTLRVGGTLQTAGDIIGDTNDIQARLPAALVSGRMDASVGAMAAGVITAASIAADAITDAKVASDVTIASVTGAVGSVTGLTASDVAAIKAKTDSLTFTVANQVDSNVQYVNDVALQGNGTAGNSWRPA